MAIVRMAREEDIPRILELYQQLALTTLEAERQSCISPDGYRRVFREISHFPGYELLVAEDEGEILGTAVLTVLPGLSRGALPFSVVEYVVVDEKCRRSGIGKLLMDYIIKQSKDASCYKIMLTSDKRRGEAHRFYRSLGFEASAEGFRLYL